MMRYKITFSLGRFTWVHPKLSLAGENTSQGGQPWLVSPPVTAEKWQRHFGMHRFTCLATICILFFTLSFSFGMFGQNKPSPESQLPNMKKDYRQWLSKGTATDLLVEFDPAPVALDIPKPRFTWIMNMQGRGRSQSAYQLLVASGREILDADEGDMWNPGMLVSDQSSQVRYAGIPLGSNREYYWKVRIRDEAGKLHPYSKTGTFSTGLIKEEEWTAALIGKGDANEVRSGSYSFEVSGDIQRK